MVKPKLVRKLSRRQQKQRSSNGNEPIGVCCINTPVSLFEVVYIWWGGGACLLDLTIKGLGFGTNTALLMMNFWRTSEPSRHVQAALLTHTPLC